MDIKTLLMDLTFIERVTSSKELAVVTLPDVEIATAT
jgi:hypothetical protein